MNNVALAIQKPTATISSSKWRKKTTKWKNEIYLIIHDSVQKHNQLKTIHSHTDFTRNWCIPSFKQPIYIYHSLIHKNFHLNLVLFNWQWFGTLNGNITRSMHTENEREKKNYSLPPRKEVLPSIIYYCEIIETSIRYKMSWYLCMHLRCVIASIAFG